MLGLNSTITDVSPDPELVEHLTTTSALTAPEAARVAEDVVAFYREPVEAWVRRRHQQLKTRGEHNPEIFAQIGAELSTRVFAAPELTERQIRRVIYG